MTRPLCVFCRWPFGASLAEPEHAEGCPATAPRTSLLSNAEACGRECRSPSTCGIGAGTWPSCSCPVKLREAA